MPTHPVPQDMSRLTLHQVAGIIDSLTPRQREAMVSEVSRGNAPGAIHAYSRATITALVNAGLAHTQYGNTALLTDDGRAVRRALQAPALPVPAPTPSASEVERLRAAHRQGMQKALKAVQKRLPGFNPLYFSPEETLAYVAAELGVPWPEVK